MACSHLPSASHFPLSPSLSSVVPGGLEGVPLSPLYGKDLAESSLPSGVQDGSFSGNTDSDTDPELGFVVSRWARLSEETRAAIVATVQAETIN